MNIKVTLFIIIVVVIMWPGDNDNNWSAMGLSESNSARQLTFKKIDILLFKQKTMSKVNNARL